MGMNRRWFLKSSGYAAAGVVLGGAQTGCGMVVVPEFPLLCTAEVLPVRVAGTRYVVASEIGCALDCNLTTGLSIKTGGAATDDGPVIAAAMASASAASPVTLIIDGGALISGLFLPAGGHWGIEGLGCTTGFFVKSGTDNDGIHNGGPTAAQPSDPGPPAPARGSDVTLRNFVLNGNQGNGYTGDSNTGAAQGGTGNAWFYGINLMNLNNITIQGVQVINTPAYHIRLSNVGNVTVSGCSMQSRGANTDGLHFDGPANDIQISNCTFDLDDDCIALNCPEGYTGDILRVSVSNCTCRGTSMMRLYTTAGTRIFNIDAVTIANCTGSFYRAAMQVGAGPNGLPESVHSLTVTDCSFSAPTVLEVSANFGTIQLTNITLTPAGLIDVGYGFARTVSADIGFTYFGTGLTLNNCSIARTADTPVVAMMLQSGSMIQQLNLNGFGVVDPAGSSFAAAPELVNIVSGTVAQLVLGAVSSKGIALPVSAGGFASIGSVSGAGVLGTGWEFPDSAMANGVPYQSASAHRAEIKVNGIPQAYP
jgi:hypothetical protein